MSSPTASYRNRNTPTNGQTDRRGFSPSRGGGALCHAPAAAPCSPQIPSSSSPSLSAKSSPCFLAPDPGDQTRGDTTAQNREQNRERIQKQHDCSVAQQASSGLGPRTGRRDGKNRGNGWAEAQTFIRMMVLQAPAALVSLLPPCPVSLSPTARLNQLPSQLGRREQHTGQGREPETHSGKGFLPGAGAARVYTGRLSWRAATGAEGDRWRWPECWIWMRAIRAEPGPGAPSPRLPGPGGWAQAGPQLTLIPRGGNGR